MKFVALLLIAGAAAAQAPDREPLADEWGYRPADGSTVALNPPSLTWVHEKDASATRWNGHVGRVRETRSRDESRWSAYTHTKTLSRANTFGVTGSAKARGAGHVASPFLLVQWRFRSRRWRS